MKKNLKIGILVIFMAALIGGYYFYLDHREVKSADDDVKVTQLDQVLSKKLDSAYPPTPREVVKFYNRIIECAYGAEYDESQFDQLAEQARKLMDQELLENNPQEDYKKRLKEEADSYKENSTKILQTTVCDSDEVVYREIEGRKCAYVKAGYFTKEGKSDFYKMYQNYLLRKDSDGNWKILGYQITDGDEDDEESADE